MTEEHKGFITADGETKEMDEATRSTVEAAFAKDLIVQDNEVAAELDGVCYDGVCTIAPTDPGHNQMVLKNLGALTGLRPVSSAKNDDESGTEGPA